MGQTVFVDGTTPVKVMITEEELVRVPDTFSSCNVDPKGPHWAQQFKISRSHPTQEEGQPERAEEGD